MNNDNFEKRAHPLAPPDNGTFLTMLGFQGFGDCIYQRPVIKAITERDGGCFLRTPWTWLYWDLPVWPVKPPLKLDLQRAHVQGLPASTWHEAPVTSRRIDMRYNSRSLERDGGSIVDAFAKTAGVEPVAAPLPLRSSFPLPFLKGRPFGVVKPNTIRKQWNAPARNPDPSLLQAVIDRRQDLTWISIARLKEGEEKLEGPPLRGVEYAFHEGQITTAHIASIVDRASLVLSGPSYMVPLCQALGLGPRALFIFGGHYPPRCLIDSRLGPAPRVLAPDPFCECYKKEHDNCFKAISINRLEQILEEG